MEARLNDANGRRRRRRLKRFLSWSGKYHSRVVYGAASAAAAAILSVVRRRIFPRIKAALQAYAAENADPIEVRADEVGAWPALTEEDRRLILEAAIAAVTAELSPVLEGVSTARFSVLEEGVRRFGEGVAAYVERMFISALSPERLKGAVLAAIEEYGGLDGAIDAVMETLGTRVYYHAERLCRTELSTALNSTRYDAALGLGAKAFMWLTAEDSRVRGSSPHDRANHIALHGKVVPAGHPFVTPAGSVMRYPGDRSLGAKPEDFINCRCSVVPLFEEDLAGRVV